MVRTGGAGKLYAVNQDLSVRHARPADIIHSNLALTPGTRLGVYDVIAPIGEGGMGQVYRATDTTLGRQVAIKILPDAFASDPDRMARFEREAKTLGSLIHPHIAAIYGFEKSAAMHALVMELVEGEDLAQRIARGAIPFDEALPVAKQIADALEAAHEKGIIHRDLKPTNIKIRPDGTVKVLDFGLAKAVDPAGTSSVDAMHSPTLTARATQMGMIIGTAAYMAPEQAKGKSVDQRADIWAFGVVLYEMLTGRRAFQGDDISEVLASVLKTDPDLSVVPADVSPSVHRLLRRCLEKDPRRRLSAIGDARLELDEIEPAAPAVRATAAPGAPFDRRQGLARRRRHRHHGCGRRVAVAVVAADDGHRRHAPVGGGSIQRRHLSGFRRSGDLAGRPHGRVRRRQFGDVEHVSALDPFARCHRGAAVWRLATAPICRSGRPTAAA